MIDVTLLPPEQRIGLSQQASTTEDGRISLTLSGTGWASPELDFIDGTTEIEVKPIIPLPNGLEVAKGFFIYTEAVNFETGTVNWAITTADAKDPTDTASQYSEISITLLNEGWSILRTSTGDAIPMIAYYKRSVSAAGKGTPPVAGVPATVVQLAGVNWLLTSHSHNLQNKTWSIQGVEV